MIFIGIDTGVNTGFATFNTQTKELKCCTLKIHQAMNEVQTLHNKSKVFVRVEDPRQRKWIQGGREKLQGVGSVKRDAKIWEDFLQDKKIPFEMVAPKNNTTKLNTKDFQRFTGYTERTSEHARDASMLVFNLEENYYDRIQE